MINFNKIFKNYLEEREFNTSRLLSKNTLHPEFWSELQIDPKISAKLIEIADNLVNSIDEGLKVHDIIITGSIASYNWHDLSDIDLHIIIDYDQIDENVSLVKNYLDSKRSIWNEKHKIMIKDHEVEVYFQDVDEEHDAMGIFSLLRDKWITEPSRYSGRIDQKAAVMKAEQIFNEIKRVFKLQNKEKHKEAYKKAIKMKEKVKKLRQSGFEKEGVYSVENLAFKLLRNNGILDQLSAVKINSYDKMMSIDEKAESERQRRWACAQMGDSRDKFKGKPSLSAKEAEKMCTDPLKKENVMTFEEEVDKYFKKDDESLEYDDETTEDLLDLDKPAPWDKN